MLDLLLFNSISLLDCLAQAEPVPVPLPGAGLTGLICMGIMGVFYRGGNKSRNRRKH